MQKIFFTPGPSQLYPSVPKHISDAISEGIGSISHRGDEFRSIFQSTRGSLRKIMGIPNDFHIFFLGSGTEGMERIVQNCVEKESLHFVNGSFSKRFYKVAHLLGKKPQKIGVEEGSGFDFGSVKVPKGIELITITQNETSTGVAIDMEDAYWLKKENPNTLLAVDVVSSAPIAKLDFSYLDCAFFSVQKCFGLPAGLGVLAISPQAYERSLALSKKISVGSYHGFSWLAEDEAKNQTPETPNILLIDVLGRVCADFQKKGIENMRKDSSKKAALLYDFFEEHSLLTPFVKEKKERSETVAVVDVVGGSSPIIKELKGKGMIVGAGYAQLKERHMRIANFPAHSEQQLKSLLALIK